MLWVVECEIVDLLAPASSAIGRHTAERASGRLLCGATASAQPPPSTMPPRKRALQASSPDPPLRPRKSARQPESTEAPASAAGGGQIYGIATHDALFKYVLMDDSIRPSFFETFASGLKIQKSERLDEHLNAIQELQHLRQFMHRRETVDTVRKLRSSDCHVSLHDAGCKKSLCSRNEKATKFLHGIVAHFEDLKKAFPKPLYDGTMDFACQLEDGNYVLVEMQVLPKDNWNKRALAYVAAFYGNQLRKGSKWKNIKSVIGINILGGGPREQVFWKGPHNHHVRHFKFQEQIHKNSCEMFIEGIEIFQYSLMNAPDEFPDDQRAKQDWIAFFKRGSHMTEAEVKSTIHTEAVLKAFERAKLSKLPKRVKADYDAENLLYAQSSQHTAELVAEGEAKGEAKGRAEGEAKGRAEGIAEGIAEGRAEGKAVGIAEGRAVMLSEVSRKLKESLNMDDAAIANFFS